MFKIFVLILITSFAAQSIGVVFLTSQEIQQASKPQVVRVYFENKQQIDRASKHYAFWLINHEHNYAVVETSGAEDLQKLKNFGFRIAVDKKLTQRYFSHKHQPIRGGTSGINGFSCYSTVEETFARMDAMVNENPSLAEIIDIGDSWEKINVNGSGYDLRVLKLTNQNIVADKPKVFIMSAVHAREYATAELNTRFAEYVLDQYDSNADLRWMIDHHELHLLLQANPDARKQAETGLLWRKNTNQAYCAPNSNQRGADLNRNFPFEWATTTPDQCMDIYAGASASSEPEITAIMNYVRTLFPDDRDDNLNDPAPLDKPGVFIDIHSFSQLMLWPWGINSNDSPNEAQFQTFGRRVAFFNNYRPIPIHDLTVATGSSVDTAYGELGVASLAFELGTEFFQDCNSFEQTILPDNIKALEYILRVARNPYQTPSGPDIQNINLSNGVVLQGDQITINAVATDESFNQTNGAQPIHNIQSARIYVDNLPWENGSISSAMAATDGTFDTSIESVQGTIDTNGLVSGHYTVYLTAQDDSTQTGPIYAKGISVVTAGEAATIQGQITDAISGQAINMASLSFNNAAGQSDAQGNFNLLALAETADLQILADGYVSSTISGLTTQAGQTLTQNIELQPFCQLAFDDTTTGGINFVPDQPWAITNSQSNSPPASWTDSPAGNYAINTDASLTSELFSIENALSVELSFAHFCDTENGFDFGTVETRIDGGNWEPIYQCTNQAFWEQQDLAINIPANASTLQFRFRLTSDALVNRDGWYIDDVSLRAAGGVCNGVLDVIFKNSFEAMP
ncbi:M14 family zinc carboxypeptidase [Marinicella sp. W31]|uniref:M14 family zinc carboxypeptidase n=1 Tax=Marinicella sp. W31 TaxID=3023713 RepID=UPI0037581153